MFLLTTTFELEGLGIIILLLALIVFGHKFRVPLYHLLASGTAVVAAFNFRDQLGIVTILMLVALVEVVMALSLYQKS